MSELQTPEGVIVDSITFRHTPMLDQVFEALSQAQLEMAGALRDKRARIKNDKADYAYNYSDLESVIDACRPALNKHGIAVVQPPACSIQYAEPLSGERKESARAVVTVTTILGHKSGQWIASDLTMTSSVVTPQAIGSTITYGRRYGLQSMSGLASEDDDGAAGSQSHGATTERSDKPERVCPHCGSKEAIIKGKEEYGGGWVCFGKKGGCGAKFAVDPLETAKASATQAEAAQDDSAELKALLDRSTKNLKDGLKVIKELGDDIQETTGTDEGFKKIMERHHIATRTDATKLDTKRCNEIIRDLYDFLQNSKELRDSQEIPTEGDVMSDGGDLG